MKPILADGWLKAPYPDDDRLELARVELAVSEGPPGDDAWRPAFLDSHDGRRVAMIRPPQPWPGGQVWLRINGQAHRLGRVNGPAHV